MTLASVTSARTVTDPSAPSTVVNPATLSAEELHRACMTAFRVGNRARYKFARALATLHATKLYLKLGYSSVAQYAEAHFGYQRSQTFDCLRVAKAFERLPACAKAFNEGRISWSALREITRAATGESEKEWLDFAREHSFGWLKAEVQDALAKGRTRPRGNGSGMPAVKVRLTFEFNPVEHDLVEKALKKGARELGEKLDGTRLEPKDVFIFLAKRMLETEPSGTPRGRVEREESNYTVLYQVCPDCRKARLPTPDGPVELAEGVVERVEDEARKVTIDEAEEARTNPEPRPPPNSRPLVRKVLHRDGLVCANPCCRRRLGLQAHHIRPRASGGATALSNEVAVCPTCHSLIHLGWLRVEGDPAEGLTWSTRGDDLDAGLALDADDELREVPVYRPESTAVDSSAPPTADEGQSTAVDSPGSETKDWAELFRKGREMMGKPPIHD